MRVSWRGIPTRMNVYYRKRLAEAESTGNTYDISYYKKQVEARSNDYVSWPRVIIKPLIVVAVLTLIISGLAFASLAYDRTKCRERAEQMDVEWDHGIWSGCMVRNSDGQWRDINDVRVDNL